MNRRPILETVTEPEDEQRLNDWLSELGIQGHRRVVRRTPSTTLVSKFEPGFAQALIARLELLPDLFELGAVRERYASLAESTPAETRAAIWHRASLALLAEHAANLSLEPRAVAEVEAGIDSVAALLDSVLFTGPTAGSEAPVGDAEAAAYAEVLERMDAESSLFTRNYGHFDETLVVNYCPGSRFARELFEQAWIICSGRA